MLCLAGRPRLPRHAAAHTSPLLRWYIYLQSCQAWTPLVYFIMAFIFSFPKVLRSSASSSFTCAAKLHSLLLSVAYAAVLTFAMRQVFRVRRVSESTNVRTQHVLIAFACFCRIVVLLLSNIFKDRPEAILLLFQLATCLMVFVFGSNALNWARLGLFSMQPNMQAVLDMVCKLGFFIFVVFSLLFPFLVMSAAEDVDLAARYARIGAFFTGISIALFALLVGYFGMTLLLQLKSARKTMQSTQTGISQPGISHTYRSLEQRLCKTTLVFVGSFFLQGLSYILVVQNNALNDEITTYAYPILFHVLDCVACTALLFLLSNAFNSREYFLSFLFFSIGHRQLWLDGE